MDFAFKKKSIWHSTYLSDIYEAIGIDGKNYIIKRDQAQFTQAEGKLFKWLMQEKPPQLLVPVELNILPEGTAEEIYEKVKWPLLDDMILRCVGRDKPLYAWDYRSAVNVMQYLSSALSALHSQNIIHHDVRPKNVFVHPYTFETLLFDYNKVAEPYFSLDPVKTFNDVPPEYRDGKCMVDATFDIYQVGRLFLAMTHSNIHNPDEMTLAVDAPPQALEIIAKATGPQKNRYRDGSELHESISKL